MRPHLLHITPSALLTLLLLIAVLPFLSRAADPTLSAFTVHQLVSTGNWTQMAPPAVASAACPPHHRFCRKYLKAHDFMLSPNTSSLNIPMYDPDAPSADNLRMQVYLANTLGVDRVLAHTGPRTSGKKNLQHALWACPIVPELELKLFPHNSDNTILRNIRLEIIFYFNACDLDVVGGENPADHLLLGVENMFTTQMVLSPITSFSSRINTNVANEGQLAVHVNLTTITPGVNRYMLVRGQKEHVIPAFNAEQGNSDQYTFDAVATYSYPLYIGMFMMNLVLVVLVMAMLLRQDRATIQEISREQINVATEAQLIKALNMITNRLNNASGAGGPEPVTTMTGTKKPYASTTTRRR